MALTLEQIESRLRVLEDSAARKIVRSRQTVPEVSLPRSPMAPFDSGTYTPTLTNGTNVAASTAFQCQWLRVDGIVNVSGKVNVDPTNATAETILGVSLPFASNLSAEEDLAGVCGQADVSALSSGAVRANPTNDRADLRMHPLGTANAGWYFIFQYQLIG